MYLLASKDNLTDIKFCIQVVANEKKKTRWFRYSTVRYSLQVSSRDQREFSIADVIRNNDNKRFDHLT